MLLQARHALLDRSKGRYVTQRETSYRCRDRKMAIPKLDLTYTALVTQVRNISHTDDLCMRTNGQMNSKCVPNLMYQYIPTGNRKPGQTRKNRQNNPGIAYIAVPTTMNKNK
jgi:hypothetical protein